MSSTAAKSFPLTLSCRISLPYRNHSIDWFLYDNIIGASVMEELSKDNLILFDAFCKHFSRELKL